MSYSVTLIKMAETGGKKGKKKKGKTVNLVEFLTDGSNKTPTSSLGPVYNTKSSSNWADESEDLSTEVDARWPEESYGGVSSAKRHMDLAALPTAPRASLEVEIDYSKIPEKPPFTAFLGNLPYDIEKMDIMNFFRDVQITEVRLPQDVGGGGRPKGFGYAEFADKESLIQALSMNNETLRGRKLRIDIAGQNQGGGDRDRGDRDEGPDLTMSDWRASAVEPSRSSNRYSSSNGYQDRRDGNRFDRRDDGGWGRDSDRDRYCDYDDRRYPDRFDERRPRDRYDNYRYRDDSHRYGNNWGYGDRDWRDGRGGRDTSDTFSGKEFTRDQVRPPASTRGPSSQNGDRESFGDRGDRGYNDRYGDRGYSDRGYGDRSDRGYSDRGYVDRGYGDRGYGDRADRGYGDRADRGYGDRGDRSYGGRSDRGYGDRDRGYGDRDRGYGDRDRGYGDRDRGYSDRDRGYGDRDRGYGDRDRGYGDRDRGYGDRDRGYGDRDRDFDRDRRDYGSRGGQDDHESEKARPRLQLKPRTKPVEEPSPAESRSSSIFGGAKPVDTTAKEREIEEKLEKLKVETDLKKEEKGERDQSQRDASEGEFRSRKDSGRSSEGEFRSRRDSGRSSEGEKPASSHGHRDSEKSVGKEVTSINKESTQEKSDPPPPVVNVWKQRMDAQKTTVTSDKGKSDASPESTTEKFSNDRIPERKVMSSNGPTSPVGRGSYPRQQNRGSERSGSRGRGRGRGDYHGRTNETADGRSKEDRRERRERKAPELKKCEDQPPVFHQTSKFSLLMDDDDDDDNDDDENAET